MYVLCVCVVCVCVYVKDLPDILHSTGVDLLERLINETCHTFCIRKTFVNPRGLTLKKIVTPPQIQKTRNFRVWKCCILLFRKSYMEGKAEPGTNYLAVLRLVTLKRRLTRIRALWPFCDRTRVKAPQVALCYSIVCTRIKYQRNSDGLVTRPVRVSFFTRRSTLRTGAFNMQVCSP